MCFFQLEVEFLFRTCLEAYCQAQPKSQQNWAELSLTLFLFYKNKVYKNTKPQIMVKS